MKKKEEEAMKSEAEEVMKREEEGTVEEAEQAVVVWAELIERTTRGKNTIEIGTTRVAILWKAKISKTHMIIARTTPPSIRRSPQLSSTSTLTPKKKKRKVWAEAEGEVGAGEIIQGREGGATREEGSIIRSRET
mmetsp:Transcript_15116/g.10983  ORF Transcript_15116/g.10983 Transcript_15116/m.10983 type:complete len:135 (+) Transcript_15116:1994-2398(+)